MGEYYYTIEELSASHNDDDNLRLGHVCTDAITAREKADALKEDVKVLQLEVEYLKRELERANASQPGPGE